MKRMLMNSKFVGLILGMALMVGCSDDDGPSAPPTISIDGATEISGTPGTEVEISFTVSDDAKSISATDGSEVFEIEGSPFIYTIPEDSEIGSSITLTITATNGAGSTDATAAIAVACNAIETCIEDGKVTVIVTVPENTPSDANIEIVGSFNDWPGTADPDFYLQSSGADICYCIAVPFEGGEEFKIRRDGDWGKVEKDASGEEISNRTYAVTDGDVIQVIVQSWADL